MSVRILIVDDHEVVRQGVRTILTSARPQWEICGEAANGQEAIDATSSLHPDIVLLDITMPVMSGLEAASRISSLRQGGHVLIFTMHESGALTEEARRVGASGFVTKSEASRHLVNAIETLLSGGTFFGHPEGEPAPKKNPGPGILFRRAINPA